MSRKLVWASPSLGKADLGQETFVKQPERVVTCKTLVLVEGNQDDGPSADWLLAGVVRILTRRI